MDSYAYPILIEHRLVPEERGGGKAPDLARLRPDARLIVTSVLRTSGLLLALSDEQTKLLLWLASSLTPNGRLFSPVVLLAQQMGISEEEVRRKMTALTGFVWNGEPVAMHLNGDGMTERYTLSPHVIGQETLPMPAPFSLPNFPIAGSEPVPIRDAVIAHSRDQYARPRAEVERQILDQMGYDPRETADTPEGELFRSLRAVGVPKEEAARLLDDDPVEARLQLTWLKYRSARDPARYLVAAVKGRYAPPVEVRGNNEQNADANADGKPVSVPSPNV